jgi:hypothetical protein
MDEVFSSQPDLTDQPISHPGVEYFMDGNSFVQAAHVLLGIQTLNMLSLPFMSMDPYIKKGAH